MNSEDMTHSPISDEMPQRAVSVYGQEGMDDFPVLKAFQQYINDEQEKARKRIIGLSLFFGAILIVVIAVFLFLLHGINMRNQDLSDRLVEYAMKESERRQVAAQQVPVQQNNDTALKAMTDTLVAIQNKLQQQDTVKSTPPPEAQDRKAQVEMEKLQNAKKQLEIEQKRLAIEKERLRQQEIEQQRRKLYPELYQTERQSEVKQPKSGQIRMLSDDDIREIIKEAYPDEENKANKPVSATNSSTPVKRQEQTKDDSDEAIEYYNDDDYSIPVDVKGTSSRVKFSLPIE